MADDAEETLPLSQVIFQAIERKICDMNVSLPCTVESYDSLTNRVTVNPAFKIRYKNEEDAVKVPPISDVPVSFPRLGDAHLVFPVLKGSQGLCIFAQRSIDRWITEGGQVDPEDKRKFHLSDAIFLPGVHSDNNPLVRVGALTSVELKNKDAFMELLSSGKMKIGNDKRELLAHLKKLVDEVIKPGLVETALGPAPWTAATLAKFTTWLLEFEDLLEE